MKIAESSFLKKIVSFVFFPLYILFVEDILIGFY